MSTQKYITEHYSRLKYMEIKNLPKTTSSPPLYPEKPPKQFLVKFTANPVESFERRISSQGLVFSGHSNQEAFEFAGNASESVKRHGFQESRIKPLNLHTEDHSNDKMRFTMPGFERNGLGAQDSLKRGAFGGNPHEYEELSANRFRKTTGAPFEEFRGFHSEINEPNGNIMSHFNNKSPHISNDFDDRKHESAKRAGNIAKNEVFQWDRPLIPHESVKRAMIEARDPSIMRDNGHFVSQIEILELEIRKMREKCDKMEEENYTAKGLFAENERLKESVKQYRSTISNFTEIERINHELIQENEGIKHRLHEFEGLLAEKRDWEARIQEEFKGKLQAERVLYEKSRREIEQLRGLEEKFYTIQAEKLNLEEEIEKIRMIKITLESQLEKLRSSYEEIEQEITIKVRMEYEEILKEMHRKNEGLQRDLMEKEARIRGNFDRELFEINAINRELKEEMGKRDEKLKKNSMNEKLTGDLKEKLMRITEELSREKQRNTDFEIKLQRILKEKEQFFFEIDKEKRMNSGLLQELEMLKNSINPQKDQLFEKVVQELEKVNGALRALQIEKESLKRELDLLRNSLISIEKERDLLKKEALQGKYGTNMKITELLGENNKMKCDFQAILREKENFQMKCGDLSAKIQEYENLSMNLHEKVKKNGFEGEKNRRFIEEIQQENSSLKSELLLIKSENSQLKSSFNELIREKESLKQEKEQLYAKIHENEGVYQRFDAKNLRFEEENRYLQAEKNDLMLKINEISRNLTSQIDINRDFKERELKESQIRSMENKRLIDQILQLSNELEGWKAKFNDEKHEKAKKAQISQFNEEKEREYREIIRKLEGEIEVLRKKPGFPKININENDIRMKYEAQITSLETRIMTLEFERDHFKGKIDEITRENRGLQEKNMRFNEEIAKNGNNSQIFGLMKENESLKSKQFVKKNFLVFTVFFSWFF